MPRRPAVALTALVVPLSLAVGACAGPDDPTAEELRDDLAEELRDRDGDLTGDQAECYARLLVDELGVDKVVDVDLSDETPPADIAEHISAAAVAARQECGLAAASG